MTILEENYHSFLIVEHDPMLHEDAGHMVKYIAQALKQTSRSLAVVSPARLTSSLVITPMTQTERLSNLFDEFIGLPYPKK